MTTTRMEHRPAAATVGRAERPVRRRLRDLRRRRRPVRAGRLLRPQHARLAVPARGRGRVRGAAAQDRQGHGPARTCCAPSPTASGFVTEHEEHQDVDGEDYSARRLWLCEVRDGRIAEVVGYCSGEWDDALRARHAARGADGAAMSGQCADAGLDGAGGGRTRGGASDDLAPAARRTAAARRATRGGTTPCSSGTAWWPATPALVVQPASARDVAVAVDSRANTACCSASRAAATTSPGPPSPRAA